MNVTEEGVDPGQELWLGGRQAEPFLQSWGSITGFSLTLQTGDLYILKTVRKIFIKKSIYF